MPPPLRFDFMDATCLPWHRFARSAHRQPPTANCPPPTADKMGNPKGFAYIEFLEADAVTNACLLDGSELRNRAIKVSPKRTNVPGMKAGRGGGRGGRGRGRGGFYGGYGMMPMMPPFMFGYGYPPYGGGGRGRGRGRGGYQPY